MAVGESSRLERVTVNFVVRASRAYRLTMARTGDIKTDIINRHVQEGAYLEWVIDGGGEIWVREPGEDGPPRPLTQVIGRPPAASPFNTELEAIDPHAG